MLWLIGSPLSSLCLTTAASTTLCHGLVQMVYICQRKKLLLAISSRLSGTLHPLKTHKTHFWKMGVCIVFSGLYLFYLLYFSFSSTHNFALICLVLDSPLIFQFRLLRSCNRSLEVEDTEEASTSPSSAGPSPTSRNNSFRDRCRNQSVILFFLLFCIEQNCFSTFYAAWGTKQQL